MNENNKGVNENREIVSLKENLRKTEKINKILVVITFISLLILGVVVGMNNRNNEQLNYGKIADIIEEQMDNNEESKKAESTIDYNKIDEIVKNNLDEREDIDYELIESIVKENQEKTEKDFGDKVEEMSDYFGEKFTDFSKEISKKINESRSKENKNNE